MKIRKGEWFRNSDNPGRISQACETFESPRCVPVYVRDAKPRRSITLSELRAWHRSKPGWTVKSNGTDNKRFGVSVTFDDVAWQTGATEAKAILKLRSELRKYRPEML